MTLYHIYAQQTPLWPLKKGVTLLCIFFKIYKRKIKYLQRLSNSVKIVRMKEQNRKYLDELYKSKNVRGDVEKIKFLSTLIGGESFSFFACGGSIDDEMKVNMLEYEHLMQSGLEVFELV